MNIHDRHTHFEEIIGCETKKGKENITEKVMEKLNYLLQMLIPHYDVIMTVFCTKYQEYRNRKSGNLFYNSEIFSL